MVDADKIVEALKLSLNPKQQREAEEYLRSVQRRIGFCPTLLRIVTSRLIDVPIRQAGAVLFKNIVNREWQQEGSIINEDKAIVRNELIGAMRHAPRPILAQLKVCVSVIVQHDFPHNYKQLTGAMRASCELQNAGGLCTIVAFVQVFRFAKPKARQTLEEAMQQLLPALFNCISSCSDWLTLHQAAKALHSYTGTSLPAQLVDRSLATAYTQAMLHLMQQSDSEERWKAKKWALRSMLTWLERYGPADTLNKSDATFGPWFVRCLATTVAQCVLAWLMHSHQAAPQRVLHLQLSFLRACVPYAATWAIVKQQLPHLINNICFPLLCHSDEEAELWECDPAELVRNKFDPFDDFGNPDLAAEEFIRTACAKRKGVIDHCAALCNHILHQQQMQSISDPRQRDGAFRLLGSVAHLLLNRTEHVEEFMQDHALSLIDSDEAFLRARGCWLMREFARAKLKPETLAQMALLARRCLSEDKELPVRAEAAAAVQALMDEQAAIVANELRPHAAQLMNDIIAIMRATVCDHLNTVLQKLFVHFRQEVGPLALCIVQQLADSFLHSVNAGADEEEQAVMAMGILSTLETVTSVLEDDARLMLQLEPLLLQIVQFVIEKHAAEYLEEAISLADSLTCRRISPNAWSLLPLLKHCIDNEGVEYFCEVANPLYNFVTVDPRGLLKDVRRAELIVNLCVHVLLSDCDEAGTSAAKLLEVMLLQYGRHAEPLLMQILGPALTRAALTQLPDDLRITSSLIVFAALVHNADATLRIMQEANGLDSFLSDWLTRTRQFVSLHDRRVCLLGVCRLIPRLINTDLVPAAIQLFTELESSYQLKRRLDATHAQQPAVAALTAAHDNSQELQSDEDETDQQQVEYARRLQRLAEGETEAELDDLVNPTFESVLDADDCKLDEFVAFKQAVGELKDNSRREQMLAKLTPQQKETMEIVIQQADCRINFGFVPETPDPIPELRDANAVVGNSGIVFNFGS